MRFLITRLWPALIPLLLYAAWLAYRRHAAKKAGRPLPPVTKGPLFWAVIASVLVSIACFVFYGVTSDSTVGSAYIPPHIENGKLVPGQLAPKP